MCKQFSYAKKIVESYIKKKEPFTFNQIKNKIIEKDGVLRISPGVTVSDFLSNLEERRIIYYDSFLKQYNFYENLKNLDTRTKKVNPKI